jgi:hypothetical protein
MIKMNKRSCRIEIDNIKFISFNDYNNFHWGKKKKYKDYLRLKVDQATDFIELKSGYNIKFSFYFKNRIYDTINVAHMIKIIEDKLFKQDNKNGEICIKTLKSDTDYNYIQIHLEKI